MKRTTVITAAAVGLASAVGLALAAAPASASHSSAASIRNSSLSILPIYADDYCYDRKFGPSPVLLYPGDIDYLNDRGFKVTAGYEMDAWRNGSQIYNNKVSDGKPICIGNDNWVVQVIRYHY